MKGSGLKLAALVVGLAAGLSPARAQDESARAGADPVANAETTIQSWPEPARSAAKMLIDKYGWPHSFTADMLLWRDNGPWKRTIVYRDGASV
ncbi:MAG: hypothetical protein PHF00_04250, partial [Elusimicrobia bacterium]|nr:hypothetical protein [Elusimicrobiota bacterium]